MLISSSTSDSYQKAGHVLYFPFLWPKLFQSRLAEASSCALGCSTEREPQEQQQQKKNKAFPL